MSLQEGTHSIGPDNGSLRIRTGREGAVAKVGHDLVLEATRWEGTVEVGPSPSVTLTVDPASIEVVQGSGGAKPLSDRDRRDIKKNILEKVLGSSHISFRSSDVRIDGGTIHVGGTATVAGGSGQISAPLQVGGDGTVRGTIALSQASFGIKQFKTFMGALKVADKVEVDVEARLPTA